MKEPEHRLLSPKEASEFLNVSTKTLFMLWQQGHIKRRAISKRQVRYTLDSLERYIRAAA